MPDRLAVCGLPLAESLAVNVAVRLPGAAGVNVTFMVQLALAASELPQLLVCAKSVLLVPVKPMLEILKAALPVFESVTA